MLNTVFKTFEAHTHKVPNQAFTSFLYQYKLCRTLEFRSDTLWQQIQGTLPNSQQSLNELLDSFEDLPSPVLAEIKQILDNFSYANEHKRATYVGMFIEGKFVGAGFYMPKTTQVGQVHQVIIHRDYQRGKLGSKLMLELEQVMKRAGISTVYAHARTYLQSFYQKLGYKLIPESEWDQYKTMFSLDTTHQVGVPHVLMEKQLKQPLRG